MKLISSPVKKAFLEASLTAFKGCILKAAQEIYLKK